MMTSTITTMAIALLAATTAASTFTTTPGCWDVSVEHDATYCIEGPICSGSGLEPAGSLCPVMGDVATADCHDYLASYAGENRCVLPLNATCQVIKTGAWGCVLSSVSSASGEADEGEVGSGSAAINATVLAADAAVSAGGVSAGVVGVVAVAAACVAALAGFALYKQNQKHSAEAAERTRMETFVDVVTP